MLDFELGPTFARPGVELSHLDAVFLPALVGIIPADVAGIHPPHDPVVPANTEELPADLGAWSANTSAITSSTSARSTRHMQNACSSSR